MIPIAEFLLARIAEDEAAARDLPTDEAGWWVFEMDHRDGREWIVDSNPSLICYGNSSRRVQEHIARHGPNRVLADCAAKRDIVMWAGPTFAHYGDEEGWNGGEAAAAEHVLCLLAEAYADHPDYKPEWGV